MRFKLDENLPLEAADALRVRGHDVDTVADEGLTGAKDPAIIAACAQEGRALITLDLDFANIVAYPPGRYPGLVVLRPARQSARVVMRVIEQVLAPRLDAPGLDLSRRLWIVDDSRIREHA